MPFKSFGILQTNCYEKIFFTLFKLKKETSPWIFPVEPPGLQLRLPESPRAQDKSSDWGFRPRHPDHVQFNSIYLHCAASRTWSWGFTHPGVLPYIYSVNAHDCIPTHTSTPAKEYIHIRVIPVCLSLSTSNIWCKCIFFVQNDIESSQLTLFF